MVFGWVSALVGVAVLAGLLFRKRTSSVPTEAPMTDHLTQAILRIETDGTISYANPAASRLLGYELNTLVGLSVEALVPEQQRHHHEHWRKSFNQSGRSRPMNQLGTLIARHQSGRAIPVHIELSSLPGPATQRVVLATLIPRDDNAAIMEQLQQDAGVGTWEWDLDKDQLSWSQGVYEMFGLDPNRFEASYEAYLSVVHPDDREPVDRHVNASMENSEPYEIEYRIVRKGEIRHLLERNYLHPDSDGVVRHMWGSIIDITDKRRSQRRLQLAETVFNYCAEGILVFDDQQQLIRSNRALLHMMHCDEEQASSLGVASLLSLPDSSEPLDLAALLDNSNDQEWRGELLLLSRTGEPVPVLASLVRQVSAEEQRRPYILVCTDIRQLKAQQAKLRHQAMHDVLTGLPNRRLFAEHLEKAIAASKRSGKRLAVIYIDLDGFKKVNDTCGHEAGDMLLREIARRLSSLIRESDTLARIGGDEFAVILPECGDDKMLVEVLARLVNHGAYTFNDLDVTLSLGAACYPDHSRDSTGLLILADQTMYGAKHSGKNRYRLADSLTN